MVFCATMCPPFAASASIAYVMAAVNLYAGPEAKVRTRHRTMDWFKIATRVCQGCILSPAYLAYIQSTLYPTIFGVGYGFMISEGKNSLQDKRNAVAKVFTAV